MIWYDIYIYIYIYICYFWEILTPPSTFCFPWKRDRRLAAAEQRCVDEGKAGGAEAAPTAAEQRCVDEGKAGGAEAAPTPP